MACFEEVVVAQQGEGDGAERGVAEVEGVESLEEGEDGEQEEGEGGLPHWFCDEEEG